MRKSQNDSLINMIKEIAVNAVNASKPTSYFYGTIISMSPLKVQLSSNIVLTKEFLIVPKSLTNYEINIEIDCYTENTSTNTDHTHIVNYSDRYNTTSEENKSVTSEVGSFNNTHNHNIKGTKTITMYNALKVNDKVILAQIQGGQEFIILDRVG